MPAGMRRGCPRSLVWTRLITLVTALYSQYRARTCRVAEAEQNPRDGRARQLRVAQPRWRVAGGVASTAPACAGRSGPPAPSRHPRARRGPAGPHPWPDHGPDHPGLRATGRPRLARPRPTGRRPQVITGLERPPGGEPSHTPQPSTVHWPRTERPVERGTARHEVRPASAPTAQPSSPTPSPPCGGTTLNKGLWPAGNHVDTVHTRSARVRGQEIDRSFRSVAGFLHTASGAADNCELETGKA